MANKPEKEKKEKKNFFKNFRAELKKVAWPTPKQLVNSTVAVLSVVLIVAVLVFILDLAFQALNNYGINKIKEAVTPAASNVIENNTLTDGNAAADQNATDNSVVDNTENNL